MAEFGVNATSLSPPQGAGANVLAPVESARQVNEFSGLYAVGDIFVKGLESSSKAAADARKNAVVGEFINKENTISQAVAQGAMTPAEAAARSRSLFRQYSGGNPEYIGDLEKAANALKGYTEKGVVEDALKTESKQREADVAQAQQRGFTFTSGMAKETQDEQIAASKAGIQAEQQLAAFYKQQEFARAKGTYDAGVAARQEKEAGFQLVNSIAGANLTAFQSFGSDIAGQVKSGKISPDQGRILLNERFSNISAALQAAARVNPELASPYRTLFEGLNKISNDMLDPKNQTEDLENQYRKIITQGKLLAVTSDPKVFAAVVSNQLLPNNASLALSTAPAGIRAMAILSDTPIDRKNADGSNVFVPQVIGDPDVEPATLKLLKQGISDLRSGRVQDPKIAEMQASNSVNHILKQTGDMINKGATPNQLKGVAAFLASPEYGNYVKNGKADTQAQGAASKTFQLLYEPTIINGVQQKLEQPLARGLAEGGGASINKPTPETPLKDVVDVKWTGSGIAFTPKTKASLRPSEERSQATQIESLKTSQAAVNQLVHIAAHMEGSTDYAKYWEQNKHIWIPSMFNAPEVKPGKGGGSEAALKNQMLTPEESARDAAYEASDKNIQELVREIGRTTNPEVKRILEDHLVKIKGAKK